MKKISLWIVPVVFLMLFVVGCSGKTSSLEGKVLDGKGQPLANVKVVAKMSQPIKGYEQFETTTGSDGAFAFKKLFPTSEYQLIFFSDQWTKEKNIKTTSGPEGQTKMLPEPVMIRFMDSREGVIADTKTGLEWYLGSNRISWYQAQSWMAGLKAAGVGWRMPTLQELKSLYIKDMGKNNIHPLFKVDEDEWIWTENKINSWNVVIFRFGDGNQTTGNPGNLKHALAVRSRK